MIVDIVTRAKTRLFLCLISIPDFGHKECDDVSFPFMALLRRSVKCLVLFLAFCSAFLLLWCASGRLSVFRFVSRSTAALGGKSGSVYYGGAEKQGAVMQHTNIGDSLQIPGRREGLMRTVFCMTDENMRILLQVTEWL